MCILGKLSRHYLYSPEVGYTIHLAYLTVDVYLYHGAEQNEEAENHRSFLPSMCLYSLEPIRPAMISHQ